MSEIQPLQIREENGATYTIYVAVKDQDADILPPSQPPTDPDRKSYGIDPQAVMVEMVEVHQAIQAYTRYAIGLSKTLAQTTSKKSI